MKLIGYNKVKGLDGKIRDEAIYQGRRKLKYAQTLNTTVKCRVCNGSGVVILGNIGKLMNDNICGHCHGSKIMKSI